MFNIINIKVIIDNFLINVNIFFYKGLYTLNNRISKGGLATQGQFPYVASITENGRHFCGGFIYSSRYVVTAASCVEG